LRANAKPLLVEACRLLDSVLWNLYPKDRIEQARDLMSPELYAVWERHRSKRR
jgi:hypothetical protein